MEAKRCSLLSIDYKWSANAKTIPVLIHQNQGGAGIIWVLSSADLKITIQAPLGGIGLGGEDIGPKIAAGIGPHGVLYGIGHLVAVAVVVATTPLINTRDDARGDKGVVAAGECTKPSHPNEGREGCIASIWL